MILSTVLVKKGAKINIKKIIDKHFFYVVYLYIIFCARTQGHTHTRTYEHARARIMHTYIHAKKSFCDKKTISIINITGAL